MFHTSVGALHLGHGLHAMHKAAGLVPLTPPRSCKAENSVLVRRLVQLKEQEVERMSQINKLHEEAVRTSLGYLS